MITISEAARLTGLPAKTIRYYEDIGLALPTTRGGNGYRYYNDHAVYELGFIKRARDFGFSIEDTNGLLALWRDRNRASSEVKRIASKHVEEIGRKIEELQSLQRTLSRLVESCHGDERTDCPILDDLSKEGSDGD